MAAAFAFYILVHFLAILRLDTKICDVTLYHSIENRSNSHCLILLQAPHSHIPYGEAGSGFYGSKVLDTMPCIEALAPIALECVRSYPVTPGSVFTIADYGCADGGSSMSLIYACVEELRKLHGNELEILIFYEDQPVNDFTSLFSFLQGTHVQQITEYCYIAVVFPDTTHALIG